jgi:hypothetical protein
MRLVRLRRSCCCFRLTSKRPTIMWTGLSGCDPREDGVPDLVEEMDEGMCVHSYNFSAC